MQTTVPNERHRTENDHTFFDVTLWGMFDRFSSVGVEYQHTLRPTPHLRDVGWYDYPNPLASLEGPTHPHLERKCCTQNRISVCFPVVLGGLSFTRFSIKIRLTKRKCKQHRHQQQDVLTTV